jgi:hypothetical protein
MESHAPHGTSSQQILTAKAYQETKRPKFMLTAYRMVPHANIVQSLRKNHYNETHRIETYQKIGIVTAEPTSLTVTTRLH